MALAQWLPDVDIAELPVTFDRQTPKTLEVTGFQASILTDTRIAQAEAQGTVELPLGQTVGDVYAVAKGSKRRHCGLQQGCGPWKALCPRSIPLWM